MITEEEYLALARQKYQELQALEQKTTFLDHEKAFETIWTDLGKQVLEKTISQPGRDRRKKNSNESLWGDSDCSYASL